MILRAHHSPSATLIALVASALLLGVVFAKLHAPWAPIPWLACMGVCLTFFALREPGAAAEPGSRTNRTDFGWPLAVVFGLAVFLRLVRIHDLPLGPYVDEIQTLRNALALSSAPFDFFGSTPLVRDDWVHTSNAYLYFNWLVLRLCGVSYLSMKLFSVIPGVLTCVFFTLMCRTFFSPRIALYAGLFFTVGHWPIRLSRYGWDAAFAVMLFSAGVWLWLLARERRREIWACASGLVMGFSLYSYLGARVSVLTLAALVAVDCLVQRNRAARGRAWAFAAGLGVAALPLGFSYLEAPEFVWLRTAELSIFSQPDWPGLLFENFLGHAGMFHLSGGSYARDNIPGIPMLDAVTGSLMLVGVWVLVRSRWREAGWIAGLLLLGSWLAGLFSLSQEGPPYVYRSAAAMVPAFLIAGFGVEAVDRLVGLPRSDGSSDRREGRVRLAARRFALPLLLAAALIWNTQLYFGLESRNVLAARVMAYELRLVVDEVRATDLPVYVVGSDALMKRSVFDGSGSQPTRSPRYLDRNPSFRFGVGYVLRAVEYLSGRRQTLATSGAPSVGVEIIEARDFAGEPISLPAILLFRPGGEGETRARARFPAAAIRYVEDVRGPDALGVATLSGARTQQNR